MVRAIGLLCLALLATCVSTPHGPEAAFANATCVSVIDSEDPADDAVMETICVDGSMKATFGNGSSYFGDVKQCGMVSAAVAGDKLTFEVDLSACDNLPSHTLVCPPYMGQPVHCMLTFASDRSERPVTLVAAPE